MPLYSYQVIHGKKDEFFEIEQSLQDSPLTNHPITGEPIKRVVHTPGLVLKHGDQMDAKKLSAENIEKNGFTVFEKDSASNKYHRTIGKMGPSSIPYEK